MSPPASLLACVIVLSPACARTPPPSTDAPPAPPALSAPSAAPPEAPSAAPPVAPSAAATIDLATCKPHPPAVRWDVQDDDVVRAFDARGCPLAESHFKSNGYSYKAAVDFMTELQARVKAHDTSGLADLANYPLRFNGKGTAPLIVKDRAAFLKAEGRICTPAVSRTILAADPRDLFCKSAGVMLGDGVIWADTAGDHYGVIAINAP